MNNPTEDDPNRTSDVQLLRHSSTEMRQLLTRHDSNPDLEYVELGIAKLLDAIASSLDRGDGIRDEVRTRALELARHAIHYCGSTADDEDEHPPPGPEPDPARSP